ncbi:MAG: hypothetical protein EBT36_13170 [Betaproteobacteria bacterium]|jgi:hypothetical protein|nr:hypothetical protein [Betaproteobacteria bacterium]HAB47341.1 hypothetical protein [Lautropia sp.]NBO96186.1 hypothetical protein [Betaproteobacteria bacterium]NBQ10439.1 hypothetical protein [Betaproteobacteria bacterium]NBT72294.1 hypothetical protein [Betaproteobacteria bacterium]
MEQKGMDGIVLAFYEPCLLLLFFIWQWWSLRRDKAKLAEQRRLTQAENDKARRVGLSDSGESTGCSKV